MIGIIRINNDYDAFDLYKKEKETEIKEEIIGLNIPFQRYFSEIKPFLESLNGLYIKSMDVPNIKFTYVVNGNISEVDLFLKGEKNNLELLIQDKRSFKDIARISSGKYRVKQGPWIAQEVVTVPVTMQEGVIQLERKGSKINTTIELSPKKTIEVELCR